MSGRRVPAAVLFAMLGVGSASAQVVTTGAITGRVSDEQGAALPGATVTVSSPQGVMAAVTDVRGRFLASHLRPDEYAVRVELQGFRPLERRGIDVRGGQRVDLTLTLLLGSFAEAVEVKGASPVVDYSTATEATTLDASLLRGVPVGRQITDAVYLASGVSNGGGSGTPNPSISGATGLENMYVVDGVIVNNPRYGTSGSFVRGYGALGAGLTMDFLDEVQVRTAGADAELGQSTGGVVSVVTKSGSNQFLGSLFVYLQPDWLAGRWREITLANGAVQTRAVQTSDFGLTLGGPIVRDRVFFFVAVDPQRERATLEARFPLSSSGEVDRVRSVTSYAAKITMMPSDGQRLEVGAFGDPSTGEMGPQAPDAMLNRDTSGFSSLAYGGDTQTLRYQGTFGTHWLVEASVGRSVMPFHESPLVDAWLMTDYTTTPASISGGKGRYESASRGTTLQYQVKSSHLIGAHEIRYGASFEDVDFGFTDTRTGPGITLSNGDRTTTGALVSVLRDATYGRIYRATDSRQRALRSSFQHTLGAYLQDKVEVSRRVTLTVGVRYEGETVGGPGGRFNFSGNWAPRLGVVVDPAGSGRSKLYVSAGTYFARLPNSLPLLAFGGAGWRILRADYFDAALSQPIPDGVSAGGTTTHLLLTGTTPAAIAPNAKLGYIREAAAGFELDAGSQLNLGVRYVHRDMPRILEDAGMASLVLVYAKDPAAQAVTYIITNPGDGYPATVKNVGRYERLTHRYDAVELTADKRFSGRWALLGSYRWSRLRGSYEGFYRNDNSQGSPGQSSLQDFPSDDPTYTEIGVPQYHFRGDIRYLGSLGEGPLPTDRPHQLKLRASYVLNPAVNLGAGLSASSGRPLTPMAANPVLNRAGEIPEAPRGAGIPTEDGFERRTPFEWSLDLHADWGFKLAPGRLVLQLDVFNALDTQGVVDYDQNTEKVFGVANPDFGRPSRYQNPRQGRLGIRFEF